MRVFPTALRAPYAAVHLKRLRLRLGRKCGTVAAELTSLRSMGHCGTTWRPRTQLLRRRSWRPAGR